MKIRGAFPKSLLWALLAAPCLLFAQEAPSTEQMIDQLRSPRTRSLRNLAVEPRPASEPTAAAAAPSAPATGPAARPSLSLLIQFGFDSADVRPESRQALRNLAQALQSQDLSGSRFAIEGHTDAKGRPGYNLRLSQRRADAVRDLLAGQGVDAARLVSTGKGANEPADPQDPYAAANRRVRVVNLD